MLEKPNISNVQISDVGSSQEGASNASQSQDQFTPFDQSKYAKLGQDLGKIRSNNQNDAGKPNAENKEKGVKLQQASKEQQSAIGAINQRARNVNGLSQQVNRASNRVADAGKNVGELKVGLSNQTNAAQSARVNMTASFGKYQQALKEEGADSPKAKKYLQDFKSNEQKSNDENLKLEAAQAEFEAAEAELREASTDLEKLEDDLKKEVSGLDAEHAKFEEAKKGASRASSTVASRTSSPRGVPQQNGSNISAQSVRSFSNVPISVQRRRARNNSLNAGLGLSDRILGTGIYSNGGATRGNGSPFGGQQQFAQQQTPGSGFLSAVRSINGAIAGMFARFVDHNPTINIAKNLTVSTMSQQGVSIAEAGLAAETNGATNTAQALRSELARVNAFGGQSKEAITYWKDVAKTSLVKGGSEGSEMIKAV